VLTGSPPARGVGVCGSRYNIVPSPQPHPLADAVTLSCKLAKASLPGEGQDEGALGQDMDHPIAET